MAPLRLSRDDARRVAVRAQLLTAHRPPNLLTTVRGLGLLVLDPISAIAPSADLVVWSRRGSAFEPRELADAVDAQELVEFQGTLRPAEDVVLLKPEMAAWRGEGAPLKPWQQAALDWVEDNRGFRLDILELLRSDGPLPSRELPDTCVRPWRSSGWNNNKNVTQMLGQLVRRGEVAVAGREGRERLWDLAERVYPDVPDLPAGEAQRLRDARRLGTLGIARPKAAEQQDEPIDVADAGIEAVVDGVRGRWRVDPEVLDAVGPTSGGSRAALLSPFDLLVYDRKRMAELFEFDYTLEMYKPAAQRRWGYYALPVLVGDELVGKLDAKADLAAGVLRVHALHEDRSLAPDERAAVEVEVADLARWLQLDLARDE
ncbi:winged helix DNA-binding domain-containing protein [Actinotalea sp. M2MS4P-6]|uniref:DNA glycosylase AlkZ-like family protein n=1 Tax=Actinotalea sp. M2MS4P-6 TaxID=2983762 RepID=UPI0021E4937D|nr:crosslink repair DNA glycosylase YcaQ family protein [Actinotalea sp. M2MS4P-6]MCV2392696.1 winged helix DNA-binding domain-containing protein [Actinotalea sp. M2MS4P-6]